MGIGTTEWRIGTTKWQLRAELENVAACGNFYVRMCLRNLGGNYLIIKVAGIPLHIGEHPEHFGCNMSINRQSIECQA